MHLSCVSKGTNKRNKMKAESYHKYLVCACVQREFTQVVPVYTYTNQARFHVSCSISVSFVFLVPVSPVARVFCFFWSDRTHR